MREILTADEVADMLKISKWMVYDLAKEHTRSGVAREHPLPSFRLGASVRFLRKDVDGWVEKLSERNVGVTHSSKSNVP